MKTTAAGLKILNADRPSLMRADAPDQGQAQPEAFAARMFAAHEGLEHALVLWLRNAPATVFHPEPTALADNSNAARVGVMQGVA